MEQVGSLVPVNPHASKVIPEQVVERVARQETQAVWNPVRLLGTVVEIRLGAFSQVADGLGSFLVGAGPDAESNSIEGMRRVLLENKRVMDAVGLTLAGANLDVVRETCLYCFVSDGKTKRNKRNKKQKAPAQVPE